MRQKNGNLVQQGDCLVMCHTTARLKAFCLPRDIHITDSCMRAVEMDGTSLAHAIVIFLSKSANFNGVKSEANV